jgi:septum formation protein
VTDGADILLASASPRRRELLRLLGIRFEVLDAGVDESRLPGEAPVDYASRLAREKARAGRRRGAADLPALGADTIVVLDHDILLKPRDRADARLMLARLSGRVHEVVSAVALALDEDTSHLRVNRSRVEFGDVPAAWIEAYARLDEPMDKAGAYAVQGLAGQWIRRIDGSYSGVMGLPLYETAELLRLAGLELTGRRA